MILASDVVGPGRGVGSGLEAVKREAEHQVGYFCHQPIGRTRANLIETKIHPPILRRRDVG